MSTRTVGGFDGAIAEVDVDDSNQRITAFRLINNNPEGKTASASIRRAGGGSGPLFEIPMCPNGETREVAIPGGAANRITQTFDPVRQRYDGVNVYIAVPAS